MHALVLTVNNRQNAKLTRIFPRKDLFEISRVVLNIIHIYHQYFLL